MAWKNNLIAAAGVRCTCDSEIEAIKGLAVCGPFK